MAVRQPRHSKEVFAQRGDALYESQIRSQVEEGNHGRIVASELIAELNLSWTGDRERRFMTTPLSA